eukprot:11678-Heterococcus_DN1.PRE.2
MHSSSAVADHHERSTCAVLHEGFMLARANILQALTKDSAHNVQVTSLHGKQLLHCLLAFTLAWI